MYCTRNVTNDLVWVGANDRRLSLFEGVYKVPRGVSYNSYLLEDDSTVLFDTVDQSVSRVFFENLAHALGGRKLDYLVIQHMEPDHSATLAETLARYPEATLICNKKTADMMKQFFTCPIDERLWVVDENTVFSTGHHELHFVMAPMVHWPEVMVTFDATDGILFSADAFGTFGALNGALFADEVDFMRDYLDEARRYYCNIVGKYGTQVQALLKKASALDIRMICPLHGFVWRSHLSDYMDKYQKWSTYTPEETGVVIAYASVYGNTANAADILACRLRDAGIRTAVYDVSVTPASEIVAAAFRFSHIVFASTTYNAGIFIRMEELLRDLAAHNFRNRTVAFLENGSWAATSGKLMREIIGACKDVTMLDATVTIRSALKESQSAEIDALVSAIGATIPMPEQESAPAAGAVDGGALHKLSYGLFLLSTRDGDRDNACIVNTVSQLTDQPKRITVAVNKQNLTHDMIEKSGMFNVSVLTEETPFRVFEQFGYHSGRETDKFRGETVTRSENGIVYLPEFANAYLSCRVVSATDYGTHTLFVAEITEAHTLREAPSATYAYYFAHIKPKPEAPEENRVGWVCKICGYFYEGETLPEDFICPLCKHGASDFEKVGG